MVSGLGQFNTWILDGWVLQRIMLFFRYWITVFQDTGWMDSQDLDSKTAFQDKIKLKLTDTGF